MAARRPVPRTISTGFLASAQSLAHEFVIAPRLARTAIAGHDKNIMSKLNTLYAIGSSAALAGALMLASMSGVSASPDIWKYEWPKTDFTKTSVDFKEIKSGGVPKDAIPSIPSPGRANEKPKFIAAADDNTLGDKEPVVGLEINGDAEPQLPGMIKISCPSSTHYTQSARRPHWPAL